MSHKQGQESHSSYMDGVRVKISEQYKPPRRINLAISYSQRLTLNKQIQDNTPSYDFALEESVKNKMKEWQTARNTMAEERRIRFEKIREERRIREEQRLKREQELKNKTEEQENKPTDNTASVQDSSYSLVPKSDQPQTYLSQSTSSGMLIPTQASTTPYSTILMPTPLPNIPNHQPHIPNSSDKSPFNISDFEADTSSPFDNMELKTINEMEELAQVLKNDDSTHKNQNYAYSTQHNQYYRSFQDPMSSYAYGNPQLSSQMKNPYVQQLPYAGTNGYYCPTDNLFKNASYSIPYSNNDTDMSNSRIVDGRSTFNVVPDIMKSLETELNNTHVGNQNVASKAHPIIVDNKKSSSASQIVNSKSKDSLDDPYGSLTMEMQQLSRTISSMGFPLPRVARACKIIGNDHKKIVEHLLAMSELLDLGFPEAQVSSALLQCDNDRDKALDVLIL